MFLSRRSGNFFKNFKNFNHCQMVHFPSLLLVLFLTTCPLPIYSRTNQEPLNIGFIFSLPWDIANTMRAPVAGPLSIVLAASMALICFAGLVFAPLWWVFGFPKRNYHMHSVPTDQEDYVQVQVPGNYDGTVGIGRGFEDFDFYSGNDNDSIDKPNYPDFTQSLFHFIPTGLGKDCKMLLACHGHGFLAFLPNAWVRLYHYFSKKMTNISLDYRSAVVAGLQDQGSCMTAYQEKCDQDIVTLVKSTLLYNIPSKLRKLWQAEIVEPQGK